MSRGNPYPDDDEEEQDEEEYSEDKLNEIIKQTVIARIKQMPENIKISIG